MKRIIKAIAFSAIAIYLTSLWNRGLVLPEHLDGFIKAGLVIALIYYIILPLSKIILMPLNLLTFGLMSFIFYLFVLHLLNRGFTILTITGWHFPGWQILGINFPAGEISYLGNLVLTSLSLSSIINILELVL